MDKNVRKWESLDKNVLETIKFGDTESEEKKVTNIKPVFR